VASLDRPGAFTSLDFALDRLVDKGGPFLTLGKDGGNPLERPRREFRPAGPETILKPTRFFSKATRVLVTAIAGSPASQ
jgi:hypothetical protein